MSTLSRWMQALLPVTFAYAKQETCQGLVLSGGGSNGAWESGVLWGLLNYGNEEDYHWDVLSGVSIGGINSSALSLFKIGNEKKAMDFIYQTWVDIQTDDIYKSRPLGMVAGLDHVSIYDTTPGKEWL